MADRRCDVQPAAPDQIAVSWAELMRHREDIRRSARHQLRVVGMHEDVSILGADADDLTTNLLLEFRERGVTADVDNLAALLRHAACLDAIDLTRQIRYDQPLPQDDAAAGAPIDGTYRHVNRGRTNPPKRTS